MNSPQTDNLGRATFHHIERRTDVRPTEREKRWFKHIERHGPQSSELLYELTRDTHRCRDSALRDMLKLRAGGFLRLPYQQRATGRAAFNPYIYDLTKQVNDYLTGCGLAEATVRPTGHWWHSYAVAAFTGSLDIQTARREQEYIPAHTILARNGASFSIPLGNAKVIPDQLFAIRYSEGYRAFLLEVDRGTEPIQSTQARKSLARSIDQYARMFAEDAHRRHYGLKSTTLALWVFTNPVRMHRFQEAVWQRTDRCTDRMLCKTLPGKMSWQGFEELHRQPWIDCEGKLARGL